MIFVKYSFSFFHYVSSKILGARLYGVVHIRRHVFVKRFKSLQSKLKKGDINLEKVVKKFVQGAIYK